MADQSLDPSRLRCGIVLSTDEDACQFFAQGRLSSVPYASPFPSPRAERVSPGHLVAVATTPQGTEAVVWRWYDAVVLGEESGLIRMWEPSHGEVVAQPRRAQQPGHPGTRAYLIAELARCKAATASSVATSLTEVRPRGSVVVTRT